MNEHELTVGRETATALWSGFCSCSSPDYEDGWYGQIAFYGDSEAEVRDQFHDHLVEEGVL